MKILIQLSFLLLLLGSAAYADALKLLDQKQKTLEERRARMNAEFERGKLQIEAGSLRQGLAVQGLREVDSEEAALKKQREDFKKKTGQHE